MELPGGTGVLGDPVAGCGKTGGICEFEGCGERENGVRMKYAERITFDAEQALGH